MMRTITFILTFILFPSLIFCQALEERDKKIASQNNVLSRTQWDYSYNKGVVDKQGKKTSLTRYNKSGDKTEEVVYNIKGLVTGSEIYEYDAKGNRTKYERSGNSGKYRKESIYDERDLLVTETGFNGAENFRNTFTYNSLGKLEAITYSVNNKTEEKRIYTYSGSASIINIYGAGLAMSSKLKMVYDSKGNVLEETLLNLDEKVTSKKNYKYNPTQQVIEEEKNQGGTLNYRLSYTYDQKGNLLNISEETTAIKKYVKKSYNYDAQGNLTEYKWRRRPEDEFNVKSYTYNQKGVCLTEHTFYPNTKFELLTKYEYEYY
jgi:hypothetical protein